VNVERFRALCLSMPHATENVQWGNDLVFKVAGKMFAVAALDVDAPHRVSFKCTPDEFAELSEQQGIAPAPYMARSHWVALEDFDVLPDADIRRLVKQSHAMVVERLPKKVQRELDATAATSPHPPKSKGAKRVR
jgi:predicted DNA-binding protein (MmcQ/YjbR family)